MRPRAAVAAVALAVSLWRATTACAQVLRGTIRDSAAQSAIPGAVILVIDSAGRTAAQSLSGETGAYRVPAAAGQRLTEAAELGWRGNRRRVARLPKASCEEDEESITLGRGRAVGLEHP